MRKTLLILSLLGLLFALLSIQTANAQMMIEQPSTVSITCPTGGAAVPVTPWTQTGTVTTPNPVLVCPTPTGAAAPIMTPVETRGPWWRFWDRTDIEYQPTCPPIQTAPTGGAAGICVPCTPVVPQPVVTPSPAPIVTPAPTGGAAPVRGMW